MNRRTLAAALLAGAMGLASTEAMADTAIKFTLDWKFQGPTAAFFVAEEQGYYKEEGLSVTIDSGNGSAGAITRVASGAYQMGFADINAIVEFGVANPGQAPKAVMMVYDAAPFGVYALKSSGITKPADLVGKRLGAPVFDASYKLFPAFAAEVGIDEKAVPRINMDPPLREAMLVRGDVDVVSGHYFSSMLDIQSKGVAKDDIVYMLYKDFGMDFYGNAVIAGQEFIKTNPDAIAAFNRAFAKAWQWTVKNPEKAVEIVAAVDPLIDQKLEVERLKLAMEANILTPYVLANGFGTVDPARLDSSIKQLATALKLEKTPTAADIWTDQFIPAADLRKLGG